MVKKYKESLFSDYEIKIMSGLDYKILFRGFIDNIYTMACFYVDNIFQIESSDYKKNKAVVITGKNDENQQVSIFLPEYDVDEVRAYIDKIKKDKEDYELKKREREIEREQKRREVAIEKQKQEHERLIFIKEQYFDIKEKHPVYVFEENDSYVTFMYIDKSKSITIKSVDKVIKEMVLSTIRYDDIHYYEKAGTIHYVTELNVQSQSFAGSFVPSKLKLTPAIVAGLFFGPMGLAIGAMKGYKPAHFENVSNGEFGLNIKSNVNRIDDRSVILNYYSENYKQYMDIELPQDIYNFLQTYIGEKKYDIVLEVEKKKYVSDANAHSSIQNIEEQSQSALDDKKMTLDEFGVAIQKLKMLLDNDLISEEEFNAKRTSLLNSI